MHKAKLFVSCKIRPWKKDEQIVCPIWQLMRTISNDDGT